MALKTKSIFGIEKPIHNWQSFLKNIGLDPCSKSDCPGCSSERVTCGDCGSLLSLEIMGCNPCMMIACYTCQTSTLIELVSETGN